MLSDRLEYLTWKCATAWLASWDIAYYDFLLARSLF